MTSGNAEFHGELKKIRLKIQIEVKIGEKNIFQRENLQNFRILKGKIVSIGIKRRGENGELHGVFWNVCDMWGFHFYLEKALPFLRFYCLFNDLFFDFVASCFCFEIFRFVLLICQRLMLVFA